MAAAMIRSRVASAEGRVARRAGAAGVGAVVQVTGPSGHVGAWFDRYGISWALQRPDFHLFGTADARPDAERLLDDLRRHLLPEETP